MELPSPVGGDIFSDPMDKTASMEALIELLREENLKLYDCLTETQEDLARLCESKKILEDTLQEQFNLMDRLLLLQIKST